MTSVVLAAARSDGAATAVMRWMLLAGFTYGVLTLFVRRIGGKDGGSDKVIVGVKWFAAAVFVGILLATKR